MLVKSFMNPKAIWGITPTQIEIKAEQKKYVAYMLKHQFGAEENLKEAFARVAEHRQKQKKLR